MTHYQGLEEFKELNWKILFIIQILNNGNNFLHRNRHFQGDFGHVCNEKCSVIGSQPGAQ